MGNPLLRMLEPGEKVGLVVVITGEGKGKTTAALGTILRSVGHNMRVCVIQFVKGDMFAGELAALRRLRPEVEHYLMGKGFCGIGHDTSPLSEHRAAAQEAITLAREKMLSGAFDVIVCDEIHCAVQLKLVDHSQLLDLIDIKPALTHLVLTGRDASPEVIERAHTVSEVRDIKHAFRGNIQPQKGIDY